MAWDYTPYMLPSLTAAALSAWLARYAWHRRPGLGTTWFTVLTLSVALWSLSYTIQLGSPDLLTKVRWLKVQYIGNVLLPLAWLALALEYGGREKWLTRRNLLLLALLPAVTLVLVWSNDAHHLMWQPEVLDASEPLPTLTLTFGPWFWVTVVLLYMALLVGLVLLILATRRSRMPNYRWHVLILLLGVLFPWLGHTLFLLDVSLFPPLDMTSTGFMVGGMMFVLGIVRFRLFDVASVARQALVDSMRDGVLALDTFHRVIDVNAAARRILNLPASQIIGRAATHILVAADGTDLLEKYKDTTELQTEVLLGQGQDYELRISPLYNQRRQLRGRLVILHDITARKEADAALLAQKQLFQNLVAVARATAERPTLRATLQGALDVARALTGAEMGSLFLVDQAGVVTHSILSRGETRPMQQQDIVGQVMDKGLAGWVLRHRQPALIPDTLQDDRWLTLPDAPYVARSVLAVPILFEVGVLGILTLLHSQVNHFSQDNYHLMQAAADQMALALQNARIYDEQRRQARRQATLYEVLRTVGSHLDPETVAHAAVEVVARLTNWTAVAILVPDEAQNSLMVRAASGLLEAAEGRQVPVWHSVCGRAFQTGRPQNVPDVATDPDYVFAHERIRSELAVPMGHGQQMLGVLNIESDQPAAFQDEDVRLAESLAEAVALALENADLFRVVEDERGRLKALIESSRDGIILVGLNEEILVMNAPSQELLRLPGQPEAWVGRSIGEALAALQEHIPPEAAAALADMQHRQAAAGEGEIAIPPRTIYWSTLPVTGGDPPGGESPGGALSLGWLWALRDVTEERQLERMRDDLLHTMVHDLRNPLNNIYGAQEMIALLGMLAPDQEAALTVARESTRRMLALVDAILDISRLESGRLPLAAQAVDLGYTIAHVLQAQWPMATEKNLMLQSNVSFTLPLAWGDPELLERVLQNLVGNAVKFTPAGGEVWVVAEMSDQSRLEGVAPGQLLVSVSDTGPGISLELQERLFRKFSKGKQIGGGSGLGLAFCKMAVEAHGGRIWVKSMPDQGATFYFTLPLAEEVGREGDTETRGYRDTLAPSGRDGVEEQAQEITWASAHHE
ncbi:MAG: GAF domain-containing protein [Chloroflexi bacterium]|nr:GAF domain-containing protein [Chloroflexota bacterium]MCI0579823.1 GAF domain-containing protein [Chloroflexota bacterium]MCI0646749.1 GAF domain-containing protein [Chloroflexota bacterium]MCI0728913.1 GAF domain-containing protein [Chloroflexota bacterium]